jgi:hypothetical protein
LLDQGLESAPAPIRKGEKPVISLDTKDPTYVSALNANRIIREALTGMAMRKMGLTEKHYLSPPTKDAGRKK